MRAHGAGRIIGAMILPLLLIIAAAGMLAPAILLSLADRDQPHSANS
jgi:hypothetical protein